MINSFSNVYVCMWDYLRCVSIQNVFQSQLTDEQKQAVAVIMAAYETSIGIHPEYIAVLKTI